MRFLLLVVISSLALISCRDLTGRALPCQEITPDVEFVVKVHDTWCLPDESLKVTFNTILEDGRCNVKDIICVWAGQAVIELLVETYETGQYMDTLTAVDNWQGSIDIGSYTLALTQILPIERTEWEVDTTSYRFRMVLK